MMKNKIFKYSEEFSLSLSEKEFLKMAIPKIDSENLTKAVENELCMCWRGIVDGEWGGAAIEWKKVLYWNLYNDGHIEQTKDCIEEYGKFKKE